MIELYGCGSPNVLKVMLMMAETGLTYHLQEVNVHEAEQYEPAFLALNLNNKVPVIVDPDGPDGVPHTVAESGAILFYLAEKTGLFLPKSLARRSEVMQWLMFQMAGVGPMFGQGLHFQYVAPDGNDYARRRYLTEVKRLYDVIEIRLGKAEYLGGADYSIADIATFPWAANYLNYKGFEIPLPAFPNLARWIAAIRAREAYKGIHQEFGALFRKGLREQREADPDKLDRFFGRGQYFRV